MSSKCGADGWQCTALGCDCENFAHKDHFQGSRAFAFQQISQENFLQASSLRLVHVHINPHFRILFNQNRQNTIHFPPCYKEMKQLFSTNQCLWESHTFTSSLSQCAEDISSSEFPKPVGRPLFLHLQHYRTDAFFGTFRKIFTTLFLRDLAPYLSYHKQLVRNACLLKNKLSHSFLQVDKLFASFQEGIIAIK